MEERSNGRVCDRENDLIAYLYGEVDEREAGNFELHLRSCEQCKVELGSFRQVRESIVAWRQESLGFVPTPAFALKETDAPTGLEPGKRSALAAIRAFLDLSPMWMKAGVAVASVVFCVAAVLAVSRLFEQPSPVIVAADKRYTETELKAIVEEAVAKERSLNITSEASTAATRKTEDQGAVRGSNRSTRSVLANDHKSRQRPLTKSERAQLAADLRLISSEEETDFEFLGDRLNR